MDGLRGVVTRHRDGLRDRPTEFGWAELNGDLPGLARLNPAIPGTSRRATAAGFDVTDFQQCLAGVGHDEIVLNHVR